MSTKENINKRLFKEIKEIDDKENIKKFLEELLIEESTGEVGYAYKDNYKKLIDKFIK